MPLGLGGERSLSGHVLSEFCVPSTVLVMPLEQLFYPQQAALLDRSAPRFCFLLGWKPGHPYMLGNVLAAATYPGIFFFQSFEKKGLTILLWLTWNSL